MAEKQTRHLAFVDYLGTNRLYQNAEENADLIEDRRNELEHAIQIVLQPYIAAKKIEIGVFSDTVLIAGKDARDVLDSAAKLLHFVFQKSLTRANRNDIRLLRGAFQKELNCEHRI